MGYAALFCPDCFKETRHAARWDFYKGNWVYRCVKCESEISLQRGSVKTRK